MLKKTALPLPLLSLLLLTAAHAATHPAAKAAPASTSADIVRAQVLLDRAHYSPGEINGKASVNLRQAVRGYQKLRQLPVTGKLDTATLAALNHDEAPILHAYVITTADVAGPYHAIPAGMGDKAKLAQLGYATIDEALGERFHASPALLQKLNRGKHFDRVGEEIAVPNIESSTPMPKAATILVSRADSTLTLLDDSGMPFAQFPASTGSKHDPLPYGQWRVNGVAQHPTYRYDPALFWDAKPKDSKATLPAGPNNPVGMVWIELSKKHYGIHGTPEPALIGQTASHGCIRLTNWDVQLVSQTVHTGVRVLLQE